jgi:RNA polymerase-binding transcription factor DksA
MADSADRAQVESAVYELARDSLRVKAAPVHRLDCEECGEVIPLARRQALIGHDCMLCVECQGLLERKGGFHG